MRNLSSRREWLAGAAASALAQTAAPVRLPRKIRLGLIGTDGHYPEILDPLPRLPDVEFVAVSDNGGKGIASLPAARPYLGYREMLDKERLDVVGVCNTNGERAAAVLACLERNVHVAAEKPLAIRRPDLERIKKAVAGGSARLTMLLPMRYEPEYLAIKGVVDSGEIGEVGQIAAQKSYQIDQRPEWFRHRSTYGGTLLWIGTHMVDLMRWSSGREFTEAVSFETHLGFPEIGEMDNVTGSLFRLDNGGIASLRMDYLRPASAPTHGDDRLRLAGTKGVVEYQQTTGVTLISNNHSPEVLGKLLARRSLFIEFLQSVYNGAAPSLSVSDVIRVTEICMAAAESADRRQIIKL